MPRAAFEIVVNGKAFCESEDITAITMVSAEVQRTDRLRISIHASGGAGYLHGLEASLAIGDEIVVRLVDRAETDGAGVLACSFCGCDATDVSTLVRNGSAAICDRCISSLGAAIR